MLLSHPNPSVVMVPDMSNAAYHGDRDAVSSSGLKKMLISPLHFQDYLTSKHTETPALRVGTAIHAALLEPEVFKDTYVVAPMVDRRTKAGKVLWEEFMAGVNGKSVVTEAELSMIGNIADQVKKHRMANALLKAGKAEQSIFWTDEETGIRCKVRPDSLSPYAILDVKSTESAHRESFPRSCVKYNYDLSAAMYQEGVRQLTGEVVDFVFLAVEKSSPNLCALYKASEEMMVAGYAKFRAALRALAECRQSGGWPGYQADGDFELVDWPRYARVQTAGDLG
ncbi:MAG: PD-(D/E)XK nuclease-like domain-containing protein [Rhodocyclaceae bacterium]|nr:PD-(D/E)XK nuclease-like domain-containing protein [Rhodocyclaceae bacterium]